VSQAPKSLNPDLSARDRFGAELRSWRLRAGLSQAALARAVHVHPDLIAKVEKAVRRASKELAVDCDAVLGAGGALVGLWTVAAADGRRPRAGLVAPVPVGSVIGRRDDGATSVIRLDTSRYRAADLAGLEDYSHVEVVCYLRPDPRLAAERMRFEHAPRRVGIFARPGSVRANRIAVSRCQLLAAVDVDLHVLDLSAPPGTPVLDIAPCPAPGGPGPRSDADPGPPALSRA
jgi:tRNA (Thr-GGU) A37 N-methylase/DNA-binding XRE family transcriptional regulator